MAIKSYGATATSTTTKCIRCTIKAQTLKNKNLLTMVRTNRNYHL